MSTLTVTRDTIDVTSNHRPDIRWRYVDKSGHIHQWFYGDKPVEKYEPLHIYHVPSVEWVFDGYGYYPDGSNYEMGHYECMKCKEEINPGYTADSYTQYIPGMYRYYVDDVEVTEKEWASKAKNADKWGVF